MNPPLFPNYILDVTEVHICFSVLMFYTFSLDEYSQASQINLILQFAKEEYLAVESLSSSILAMQLAH